MADPILTRVQFATYKPVAGVQVPTNATVAFYRPGATATDGTTIGAYSSDNPIDVNDSGTLSLGDTITAGPGGASLVVDGIPSLTQITVSNNGGASVSITEGMRLILPYDRPALFPTRGGERAATSSLETDEVTGRGSAYLAAARFDYTVQPEGESTTVYPDAPGGAFRSEIAWNDVRDFASIQDAIDALPEGGGVVYLPTGYYNLSAGLEIDKESVTLLGDGLGTVIRPETASIGEFDLITVSRGYFRACNLKVDGRETEQAEPPNEVCGIVMGRSEPEDPLILGCSLENVQIQGASKYGLWLKNVITFLAVHVECLYNPGHGVRVETVTEGATTLRFLGCVSAQNGGKGFEAEEVINLTVFGCVFEGNHGGAGGSEGNGLEVVNCPAVAVLSCYFENAATAGQAEQFLFVGSSRGAVVDGCWFSGGPGENYPLRAVNFQTSPFSRLSNNSGEKLDTEFALFSNDCDECVEMCNDDRDFTISEGIARITINGNARVIGMSRRALGLPTHEDDETRPEDSDARAGSLLWNEDPSQTPGATSLQVWNGAEWQSTPLELPGVSLVNQSDSILTTDLVEEPAAGLYTIDVYAMCTAAASAHPRHLDVTIGWTDNVGATTFKVIDALSLDVVGRAANSRLIRVASGSITYSTEINLDPEAVAYALDFRVIALR